jgi:restriction system protein
MNETGSLTERGRAKRYWAMHLGEGGKYVQTARELGFVAIGWHELGDLTWLGASEREAAARRLRESYTRAYGGTSIQVGLNARQIWNFCREMYQGDVVVVPDPSARVVMVGTVTGRHEYKQGWGDTCPYPNRRTARWIKEVARDDLSQKLKNTLGSLLTIFSLDAHATEIEEVLGTVELTGPELVAAVLDSLATLGGYQFQHLVADVLDTMGFTTVEPGIGPDWGTDVVGVLNASDLANVTFRVQVKKVKGRVGRDEVSRIRGVLAQEEQGAIVSLRGFTAQARREAENPKLKPVTLIDGETLVDHMLRHYDDLPGHIKELLPLRRREIPPAEQFVFVKRS